MKQQGRWTAAILGAAFVLSMTGCEGNITGDSTSTSEITTKSMQTELFTDSSEAETTTVGGDISLDSSVETQLFAKTTEAEKSAANAATTTTQIPMESENAVTDTAKASASENGTTAASKTDSGAASFSKTSGIWKTTDTAEVVSLEMDGKGAYNAYTEDGSLLYQGNMKAVDEYGDGDYRYDLYDGGAFVMGFYFDSDTQIHIGNAGMVTYTKQ